MIEIFGACNGLPAGGGGLQGYFKAKCGTLHSGAHLPPQWVVWAVLVFGVAKPWG